MMHGATLHRIARDRALELPQTEQTYPFGPAHEVLKVGGKMFLLLTQATGEPTVTVKAAPADARVLCEAYADISPGYHMNKLHWITLSPGTSLDRQVVEDIVTESYLLVIERNLPKRSWPVNPATFGQPSGTQSGDDDA